MVAGAVLMLGISGALITLQRSLSTITYARQLDMVSSLLHNELERLRTRSWAELETLPASAKIEQPTPNSGDFAAFTYTRTIRDLKPGMKEIVVEASWGGADGRARQARLITRYARSGLNDYFYTTR